MFRWRSVGWLGAMMLFGLFLLGSCSGRGADVGYVEALADRFLDDPRLVELPAEALTSRDVIRRGDGETALTPL